MLCRREELTQNVNRSGECHFFVGFFYHTNSTHTHSFQLCITAYHDDGANMKSVQEKYHNRVQLRLWRWLSHSIRERLHWRGFLVVFKSRNITMLVFSFRDKVENGWKKNTKRDKNFMSFFLFPASKGKLVYCLRSIASPAIFMFETGIFSRGIVTQNPFSVLFIHGAEACCKINRQLKSVQASISFQGQVVSWSGRAATVLKC